MKILITGVCGVVGTKLEKLLTHRGHDIFGVDLSHTNRKYSHSLGAHTSENYYRCDIGEFRQIQEVIDHVKPDFV